jgi:hypothetical protein
MAKRRNRDCERRKRWRDQKEMIISSYFAEITNRSSRESKREQKREMREKRRERQGEKKKFLRPLIFGSTSLSF